MNKYLQYLDTIKKPFKKLCKLEFLNADGSVAFALDNNYRRGYHNGHDSRAFVQDGNLSVNLQNGQRRQATVTLANIDNAFDYSVNKTWYGTQIRLCMGVVLPDMSEFYLPQGVFYVNEPQTVWKPTERTITYNLVDKWTQLDGTLFGFLEGAYQVDVGANIFEAMESLLKLSRYDMNYTTDKLKMIDNVAPIFTSYYNGLTYDGNAGDVTDLRGLKIPMTQLPFTVTRDGGSTMADVILDLNSVIVGIIGYDCTGALNIEPSQDDINDSDKPILWNFTPRNSNLVGVSETAKNGEVYNDVIVVGQSLTGYDVWGRATNYDALSDTNVNIIGKRTLREENANYWNTKQCVDLATWRLKKKTILQKSVTIEASQMFHLSENRLVTVAREDKEGMPTEKHIIQSLSIPLGEQGSMQIGCTSVNDIPDFTISEATGG